MAGLILGGKEGAPLIWDFVVGKESLDDHRFFTYAGETIVSFFAWESFENLTHLRPQKHYKIILVIPDPVRSC